MLRLYPTSISYLNIQYVYLFRYIFVIFSCFLDSSRNRFCVQYVVIYIYIIKCLVYTNIGSQILTIVRRGKQKFCDNFLYFSRVIVIFIILVGNSLKKD